MKATNIIMCILMVATIATCITDLVVGSYQFAFIFLVQLGWLSVVWYLLSCIHAKTKMIAILREQIKSIQSPIQTNKIK